MKKSLFALFTVLFVALNASAQGFRNPVINADVPDNTLCRVGDYYYMVSTTMHLMPGAPVMRSKDLRTWETISYVFDRIDDGDRYNLIDGKTVYGQGQWASCIRYYFGKFYVWFTTNGSPNGFLYSAKDPAGPWTLVCRPPHFHDSSFFVDDDGRVYMFYGTGEAVELTRAILDETGKVWGQEAILRRFTVPVRDGIENGLLEGNNMNKINGKYYLLMISWPRGGVRREVCYRSESVDGPWEKKVILDYPLPPFKGGGVAQGAIVDSPTGQWHGIFFQDRGGVGRVPCYVPCRWVDGWPMLGDAAGKVPDDLSAKYVNQTGILGSDEFDSEKLSLYWEFNHNPIAEAWSLSERPGFLRLKTNRVVENIFTAPNTITQRMQGPKCSGTVKLDISHMQDGDRCGLSAFCGLSGILMISKEGKKVSLSMEEHRLKLNNQRAVDKVDVTIGSTKSVSLNPKKAVYLRIDGDFTDGRDIATFSYSLDGKKFVPFGKEVKMVFDISTFFMGTKFAIFNFATKAPGGYIDADWFHFTHEG
ncbi:MAG: glycoside hydrolase 43 family protein [Bacteroidaceae bacterium]|nr:glycoside hydrolase 43 family protein [Bacteroidaceae bacterium]